MPTKRRRVTRGRLVQPLSLALMDLLLGHERPNEEVEALIADGVDYDRFLQFDSLDVPALQKQYHDELDAERTRRARDAKA
jgi:hypothetical protein